MIVFGSTLSPFVRKVVAFAGEKGIEIELRQIALGSPDSEFVAASPFRKMPALKDGDFNLADSSAIVTYMDAVGAEPALIPTEPRARGRTIWWDEFADTILFGCGRKMFFNRIVGPRFLGLTGNEAEAEAAEREELPPILDYLERSVSADGFLVEERLTLADIALASPFANLRHLGTDLGDRPRLKAYVDRILARPSFAGMIAKEAAFLNRTG